MYTKISILLIGICICAAKSPSFVDPNVQLMKIMSSQLNTEGRAANNLGCFGYYIPKLNAISTQYEKDYGNCDDVAQAERSKVDSQTINDRNSLETSAEEACNNLKNCVAYDDSVKYFNCFMNVGAANSKQMYQISANSSQILSQVQEQYRLITLNDDACKKVAERNYVEGTADTYEQLNRCLAGQSEVPSS